jgi:hypothetical protein
MNKNRAFFLRRHAISAITVIYAFWDSFSTGKTVPHIFMPIMRTKNQRLSNGIGEVGRDGRQHGLD